MNLLNRMVLGASLLLAIGALSMPVAIADQVQIGDSVHLFGADRIRRFGESEITNLSRDNSLNFRTFALDRVLHAGLNGDAGGLRVSNVSDQMRGGDGQLSAQTAYLYAAFRDGALDQYDYSPGTADRAESASELQRAMWYLEGEIDSVDGLAQQWVHDANRAVAVGGSWYSQWGNGEGGYNGMNFLGNVRVLNLRAEANGTGTPGSGSDVLAIIPAPGALLLGLIGLAGLRAAKRLS